MEQIDSLMMTRSSSSRALRPSSHRVSANGSAHNRMSIASSSHSNSLTSAVESIEIAPPPSVSLRRGRKRKDGSLESIAPDVAAILSEHYAKRGKLSNRMASATAASTNANTEITRDETPSTMVTTPTNNSSDMSDLTPSSLGHTPRTRNRRMTAHLKKKKIRLSKAARDAAAEAAVANVNATLSEPSSMARRSMISQSLTQSLPFFFHMLDTNDLLHSARVSPAWYLVAQSPIVWNSSSALTLRPSDLSRVARSSVLRHAKRMRWMGEVTRDEHVRRHLLALPQLTSLEIEHLQLAQLYTLTEEIGFLGKNLTSLTIHLDSSLCVARWRRHLLQLQWEREDQLLASNEQQQQHQHHPPQLSTLLSIPPSPTSRLPPLPPPLTILSPPSSSPPSSSPSPPSVGLTRRLPSLYSFISFLSLLPNLTQLTWVPIDGTDFIKPNLRLTHLTALTILYPNEEQLKGIHILPDANTMSNQSTDLLAASSSSPSSSLPTISLLPPPSSSPPRDKTPDQLTWLRGLPSLTSLHWPGWSLHNIRTLCLPVLPQSMVGLQKSISSPSGGSLVSSQSSSPRAAGVAGSASGSPTFNYPTSGTTTTLPRLFPPQLLHLNLRTEISTDAHLLALSRLQSLTSLAICIADTTVSDVGLQSLCSLELLQHLELKGVTTTTTEHEEPLTHATTHTHPHSHPHLHPPRSTTPVTQLDITISSPSPSPSAGLGSCSTPTPVSSSLPSPTPQLVDQTIRMEISQQASIIQPNAPSNTPTQSRSDVPQHSLTRAPSIDAMPVDDDITMATESKSHAAVDDDDDDVDGDDDDSRLPRGGLLRQPGSIVSSKSLREARSALRSVSMRVAAENARLAREGITVAMEEEFDAVGAHGLTASHVAASSHSTVPRPRRSFADLEVVRLASLCSLRSLELESIDLGREGFHIILHSLHHLTALTLRHMPLPTLHPLACLTKLRRLALIDCRQIRPNAFMRTMIELKSLHQLTIERCDHIHSNALEPMRSEIAANTSPASSTSTPTSASISASSSSARRYWPLLKRLHFEPSAHVDDHAHSMDCDDDEGDNCCSHTSNTHAHAHCHQITETLAPHPCVPFTPAANVPPVG